jgi:hypothetical protein
LPGQLALILAAAPLFPPTALAAIALCAAGWRKPGSLVRPQRWQLPAALILALVQLGVFGVLMMALLQGQAR